MYPFTKPLELIRYLIVWRVNGSLVRLPRSLTAEISRVLGALIAERLPTQRAAPWRKALAPWEKARRNRIPPDAAWPLRAVLFAYPGKGSYGPGELILWELKLLGESADHAHFLEEILPAIEAAATTTDPRWHRPYSLWGRFDLQGIYAARGRRWEPFVQADRLDLHYSPSPHQWLEGLPFQVTSDRLFEQLTWLTPFDLSRTTGRTVYDRVIPPGAVPTLQTLLQALVERLTLFLPGKHKTADDVWAGLEEEERAALQQAVEDAGRVPVRSHRLEHPRRGQPGRWIGSQTFPFIPPSLLPYLELASILHVGQQTHLGCGTFTVG